jgi:hypothetical protein
MGRVAGTTATATCPTALVERGGLIDEIAAAHRYRIKAKSANTLRAYASDWTQFEAWCAERSLEPLPGRPEVVATWLAALAMAWRLTARSPAMPRRSPGTTRGAGEVAAQHRDPRQG